MTKQEREMRKAYEEYIKRNAELDRLYLQVIQLEKDKQKRRLKMKRLTHKIVYDNEHCQYVFDYNQESEVGTKLGELEDVLEKYGIENAEDLDKFIHHKDCQIEKWKQDYENCSKLEKSMSKEHQYCLDNWRACEQELAELKQKAIVPKFQVGQECWGAVHKSFWNEDGYSIHFKVKAYIPDNIGIVLVLEDDTESLHYSYEHQVFATKEEAEKKSIEFGGKDE